MEWTWVYLFFAVIHPISEMIPATSLQKFLNLDFFRTGQENYPVSKVAGVLGSLGVLVLLILPLYGSWVGGWYLALGLAFADLVQHAVHAFSGERKTAPLVHLATILPVCILLPILQHSELSHGESWGWVLIGASIIFGNWGQNHVRAHFFPPRPA